MCLPAFLTSVLLSITGLCSAIPGPSALPLPQVGSAVSSSITLQPMDHVVAPNISMPGTILDDPALLKNTTLLPPRPDSKLPTTLSFCNHSSDAVDHRLIRDMLGYEIAMSTANELIEQGGARIWGRYFPSNETGTQVYVCNYNDAFAVAHSLRQANIVNDMLNSKCGDAGGWVYFHGWNMWFGRDSYHYRSGGFRPVCNRLPSSAS